VKIVLFGATGMIGQGVLRECLLAPDVETVLAIGRTKAGVEHAKLREIVQDDPCDLAALGPEIAGCDACFFCLGVSSFRLTEDQYRRITFDLTLEAARAFVEHAPHCTFVYVSGAGTDSTEKGGSMWARVKGQTENALLKLPLRAAIMFRPGFVQPRHGVRSKTALYRLIYATFGSLFPLWKLLFPKHVMTTETMGRAMLEVARHGAPKPVLEPADIIALGENRAPAALSA
jgi:uncharacterized protein YbjT (DUF2867 family)